MRRAHRIRPAPGLMALLFLCLVGCGSGGATPGNDGSDLIRPFVGAWTATSLVHRSNENPGKLLDLVAAGGRFALTIQADGRYRSELELFGASSSEAGRLEVDREDLVFYSDASPDRADPAHYTLSGDRLTLEGTSTFDFPNDEAGPVSTTLRIELER